MKRLAAVVIVLFGLTGCFAVGPAGPYRNGQIVDLSITQFDPGDTVWLSECAPAQVPSATTGCLPSRTGQPSVRLDSRGSGSAHFRVASRVANTNCAGFCVIAATNGKRIQTTPISFAATGHVYVIDGIEGSILPLYVNGKFDYRNVDSHGFGDLSLAPGVYRFDFYPVASPGKGVPVVSTTVIVNAGQETTVSVLPDGGSTYKLLQGPVPPPAPTGQLRVRIINASAVTVTVNLDNVAAPVLRPGQATTLLVTPPANIPVGHDTAQLTYPQTPPAATPCFNPNTSGTFQQRGHGYLMPVLSIVHGTPSCPYLLGAVVFGGAF